MDGRECRIGNPGSGGGGRGGRWLGLSIGVFGTLVMHSPKVPHPDFSVQVVRHNLKIFFLWKTSGRSLKTFDLGRRNGQPRKARRLGQPLGGATAGGKTGARLRQPAWLDVLPETGNIGCIPIEKNAYGGNAGLMVISSASTRRHLYVHCVNTFNAIHLERK